VQPTAAAWERAEAYQIPLRMTPPHPRSDDIPLQSIETLEVRALAASDGVAIRIAWRDDTTNLPPSPTGETARFPDGVAVQFPAGPSAPALPALAMGSPEKKVNIWHWLAGSDAAEEGVAEGFGRFQAIDGETPVRAAGSRVDGGWAVTLWRPYTVEPEVTYRGVEPGTGGRTERVAIEPGARLSCAFAVWNGAYKNRGGLKGVSIWYYLQLPAR
jgi:DMSO reductase family type II enzyme heme b subunit